MKKTIIKNFLQFIIIIPILCLFIQSAYTLSGFEEKWIESKIFIGSNTPPEFIIEVKEKYGFYRPFHIKYFETLKKAFTLNFGFSSRSSIRVIDELKLRAKFSLPWIIPSYFISIVLGFFMAYLTVRSLKHKKLSKTILFSNRIIQLFPQMIIIFFLQFFIAFKLKLVPLTYIPNSPKTFLSLILPIISFLIICIPSFYFYFKVLLQKEVKKQYILTLKSIGLTKFIIASKYLFKNSIGPILKIVSIELPLLFIYTVIIESFFNIPGLGSLLIKMILSTTFDFNLLSGYIVIITILILITKFIIELIITNIDERLI